MLRPSVCLNVLNWALADWQLSRLVAAGRLSDRIGACEWFERRYVVESSHKKSR